MPGRIHKVSNPIATQGHGLVNMRLRWIVSKWASRVGVVSRAEVGEIRTSSPTTLDMSLL